MSCLETDEPRISVNKNAETYPKLSKLLVDCLPYQSHRAMLLWSMIVQSMFQGEASFPTMIANHKCYYYVILRVW